MPSTETERLALMWRKARRSMGNGECVEVAPSCLGIVIRDSRKPDGSILQYRSTVWMSFVQEAKQGNFDVSRW